MASPRSSAFLASLPPEIELVAVDASDAGTPELLAELRPARTRVVRSPAGIAEARQIGAEAARGAWLLFTDADVAFEPGYFAALARLEVGDATGGVVGAKTSRLGHPLYWRLFQAGQRACAWLGIPAASGSNMLIARAAFERVGGFDLELACNEDSEILWRVARAGYRVRFAPELAVAELDDRRLARRGPQARAQLGALRAPLPRLAAAPLAPRGLGLLARGRALLCYSLGESSRAATILREVTWVAHRVRRSRSPPATLLGGLAS